MNNKHSKKLSRCYCISLYCLIFLGLSAASALGSFEVDIIFDEEHGYSLGTLNGQQGWVANNDNVQVIEASGSVPVPPTGTWLVSNYRSGSNTFSASKAITEINEPFTLSVWMAFSNPTKDMNGSLYLTKPGQGFGGIIFGFVGDGETVSLTVRSGNTWISLASAAPDTFYEFRVNMSDPSSSLFDISVWDADGQLIASRSSNSVRNGVNSFSQAIFYNFSASSGGTDNAATLYISQFTVIPEPAQVAVGLLVLVVAVVAGRKRFLRK